MFFYTWSALIVLFPLHGMLWCDIKTRNTFRSQLLAQSFQNPWNFLSDREERSIFYTHSKAFQLHLSLYYQNDVFGKSLRMGGSFHINQPCDLSLSALPSPALGKGRRAGIWVQLPLYGQWLNQLCLCNEVSNLHNTIANRAWRGFGWIERDPSARRVMRSLRDCMEVSGLFLSCASLPSDCYWVVSSLIISW